MLRFIKKLKRSVMELLCIIICFSLMFLPIPLFFIIGAISIATPFPTGKYDYFWVIFTVVWLVCLRMFEDKAVVFFHKIFDVIQRFLVGETPSDEEK